MNRFRYFFGIGAELDFWGKIRSDGKFIVVWYIKKVNNKFYLFL